VSVCVIVVDEMVSRISGPIPPHPCYEKVDARSHTCIKVPATAVQHQTEQTTTQRQESLRLALEVEGHAMPSAYRHTSLCTYFIIVVSLLLSPTVIL